MAMRRPVDLTSAVFDQQDEGTPVSTEEGEDVWFENLGRMETSLAEEICSGRDAAGQSRNAFLTSSAVREREDVAGWLAELVRHLESDDWLPIVTSV
jgi:hypothetical protein